MKLWEVIVKSTDSPVAVFMLTELAAALTPVTVPVRRGAGVCADTAETTNAVTTNALTIDAVLAKVDAFVAKVDAVLAKIATGYFMEFSLNDGILNSKGVP